MTFSPTLSNRLVESNCLPDTSLTGHQEIAVANKTALSELNLEISLVFNVLLLISFVLRAFAYVIMCIYQASDN